MQLEISSEELQQALDRCLGDPSLKRLYANAPEAARRVIELSFYSTVFPDRIDGHRFRTLLRARTLDLSEADLNYLIRFEEDADLRRYFKDLLAERSQAPRRKLGVIRPGNLSTVETVDLNAESMKRRMAEEEAENARLAARAAAAERKAGREALVRNLIVGLVAVVVLGGGGFAIYTWRAKRTAAAAAERHRVEQAERLQAEQTEAARQVAVKESREKAEAERVARDERIRRRRERDERLEKERQAAEAARRVEDERRAAEERAALERYAAFVKAFEGLKLKPWSALPKNRRPGGGVGVLACYAADAGGRFGYYEVTSADGSYVVTNLLSDGSARAVDMAVFEKAISEGGCLARTDDAVYCLPSKDCQANRPFESVRLNPSFALLGPDMFNFVSCRNIKTREVAFAVYVCKEGEKLRSPDATVDYGGVVDGFALRETLEKQITSGVRKKKPKLKKRRVVFYDGEKLECRMEIVRVPRYPSRPDAKYRKWLAEAEREEQAERDAIQRAEDEYREAVAAAIERELGQATMKIRMIVK